MVKLHFINGIKNQHIDILKQNLKTSVEKLRILEHLTFYQDNDPKHKVYTVRNWLLNYYVKVLATPPQSSVIIIIKNLWNKLDDGLRQQDYHNKIDLKIELQEDGKKYNLNIVNN